MLRRRNGTFQGDSSLMSFPATQMCPVSGDSSLVSSRRNVDLPDPDGPTRNTNSPLPMSTVHSRRATVVFLYDLVTLSSRIMGVAAEGKPAQGKPAGPAYDGTSPFPTDQGIPQRGQRRGG